MTRSRLTMVAAALVGSAACVAENSAFVGPGFYDPVDGSEPAPVWLAPPNGEPLWNISQCPIVAGDDATKPSWRFGRVDDCSDAALFDPSATSQARRSLTSVEIPAAGSLTLSFETRVSLPSCGDQALVGGRVDLLRTGAMPQVLEFDDQLAAIGRTEQWFAGVDAAWRVQTHSREIPAGSDTIEVRFGIVIPADCLTLDDPAAPCRPESDAPECGEVVACCEAAFAPGPDGEPPRYAGWQLDEIRLEVSDAP